MIGILNVDKPAGITSFRVVATVKKLSGERRVGHAGTLDPMATGVLPVCLGQATRFIDFFTGMTKTYRAEIELGVATDTYDASGRVTRCGDPSHIDRRQLESALVPFRGPIQQTPPMYSAVKFHGKPLYALAREGITVARNSRPAHVYSLTLLDWQCPIAAIEITCGKGTYIRAIAHDLGQALGCGGSLRRLVRTAYGPFDIKEALSVSEIGDALASGQWQAIVHPPDSILAHLAAVVIDGDAEKDMRMGRPVTLPGDGCFSGKQCRAYALDGRFLGVLRFNAVTGGWQPEKVLLNS